MKRAIVGGLIHRMRANNSVITKAVENIQGERDDKTPNDPADQFTFSGII